MCVLSLNRFSSKHCNKHIFQVMWSNFIKTSFCYFSIFSPISKSQISPKICVKVHESMQNNFFFVLLNLFIVSVFRTMYR